MLRCAQSRNDWGRSRSTGDAEKTLERHSIGRCPHHAGVGKKKHDLDGCLPGGVEDFHLEAPVEPSQTQSLDPAAVSPEHPCSIGDSPIPA